jgi:hypothetical protein
MLAYCSEACATIGRLLGYLGSIALVGVLVARLMGEAGTGAAPAAGIAAWPQPAFGRFVPEVPLRGSLGAATETGAREPR